MIDPNDAAMLARHTLIGSLFAVIVVVCGLFAAIIFITETLPKAWWRCSKDRKRLLERSDFAFRYGRPEVKP